MDFTNPAREIEFVAACADAAVAKLRQRFELKSKDDYPCCIGCGEFTCFRGAEWCPASLDAVLGKGTAATAQYHVDGRAAGKLEGNPDAIVRRGGADALELACYQAAAHLHRGKDARVVIDEVSEGIYRPLVVLVDEYGTEKVEDPLDEAKLGTSKPCECGEAHG